jgi:hypothetical protein
MKKLLTIYLLPRRINIDIKQSLIWHPSTRPPISFQEAGAVEPPPAQAVILSLPVGGKMSRSDRKGAFPTHEMSLLNRRNNNIEWTIPGVIPEYWTAHPSYPMRVYNSSSVPPQGDGRCTGTYSCQAGYRGATITFTQSWGIISITHYVTQSRGQPTAAHYYTVYIVIPLLKSGVSQLQPPCPWSRTHVLRAWED